MCNRKGKTKKTNCENYRRCLIDFVTEKKQKLVEIIDLYELFVIHFLTIIKFENKRKSSNYKILNNKRRERKNNRSVV